MCVCMLCVCVCVCMYVCDTCRFIPPFITPSMPSRLYFLFGRPFKLTKDLASDRQAAEAVYSGIKVRHSPCVL